VGGRLQISKSTLPGGLALHLALIGVAVAVVFVLGVERAAILCAIVAVAVIADRFPLAVLTVTLLFESSIRAFELTGVFSSSWLNLGTPLRVLDLMLVGMAGALTWSVVFRSQTHDRRLRRVVLAFALLSAWVLFEAARNYPIFGLSALGELRMRYLIFVVPLYVMYYFSDMLALDRLVRWYLVVCLFLVVAVSPVIIALRGGIGALLSDRLVMPITALGLVYGSLLVFMGAVRWDSGLQRRIGLAVASFAVLIVFLDGRRSVWIAAVLAGMVLFLIVRRSSHRWVSMASIAIAVVIILGIAASSLPSDSYVTSRVKAVTSPLEDSSAVWRISTWNAVIGASMERPIIGHGLGGYWDLYVPELDMRLVVQPHNAFVQMFYHLGVIGLILYLTTLVVTFTALWAASWSSVSPSSSRARTVCRVALAVLVAAQGFSVAFSIEMQSLAIVGMGLAAAVIVLREAEQSEGTELVLEPSGE